MKKNKNIEQITAEDIYLRHTKNQLKRRNARLLKEEARRRKKLNDVFKRRVRESSDKKAPKTVRTKAYYHFAKDYPTNADPSGYRENRREKKRLSPILKLVVFICCAAVFAASFVISQVCVGLSKKGITSGSEINVVGGEEKIKAWRFSPDELRDLEFNEISDELKKNKCNAALFEFKDERGYVFFDIGSFSGGSADKKISGAWDKISALEAEGIKTCAYISCFKDNVAAHTGFRALSSSAYGKAFYDEKSAGWLDPFSSSAAAYLLNIIEKAHNGGFSYILLDNVCFPLAFKNDSPAFSGDATARDSKNTALLTFIDNAVNTAGGDKIIVSGDISSFAGKDDNTNEKYGGRLLSEKCKNYALDMRIEKQNPSLMPNSKLFDYLEEMPEVFILDAGKKAKEIISLHNSRRTFAIVDKTLGEAGLYAEYAGIGDVIIW